MLPERLLDRFIQIQTDHSGTISEIMAGKFNIAEFSNSKNIYEQCPFLELTLDALPLNEYFPIENMFIKGKNEEFNVDVELFRSTEGITITIINRTSVYKYVEELNQSRNETAIIKSQLDRQNVELERLRDVADKANHEKSRFLAMMSHEIRNPLNTILGYGDIILSESNDPIINGYTSSLLQAGENLKVIANDILDLSRIEAGKLKLVNQPISIANTVETCVANLKLNFNSSIVPLEASIDSKLSTQVLGDAVRLQQILSNLISNSYKFTQTGSIQVRANVKDEDQDSLMVEFVIEDTGRGMNQEQIDRIFEEYEQVDDTDYQLQKGAGLGLSIVQRLVSAMKGSIKVRSTINKGTTFEITIPFSKSAETSESKIDTKAKNDRQVSLNGISVLFADDDQLSHVMIGHILSNKGAHTIMVNDGEEALNAIKKPGLRYRSFRYQNA